MENGTFLQKSRKTWNSQGILYNIYPSQGNVKENKLSPRIIFIICIVLCKSAVPFVVSKCEFYQFA